MAVGTFTVVAFARDSLGVVAIDNTSLTVSSPASGAIPSSSNNLLYLAIGVSVGGIGGAIGSITVAWWQWKRKPPPKPGP